MSPITDVKDLPSCLHGTYLKALEQLKELGLVRFWRNNVQVSNVSAPLCSPIAHRNRKYGDLDPHLFFSKTRCRRSRQTCLPTARRSLKSMSPRPCREAFAFTGVRDTLMQTENESCFGHIHMASCVMGLLQEYSALISPLDRSLDNVIVSPGPIPPDCFKGISKRKPIFSDS